MSDRRCNRHVFDNGKVVAAISSDMHQIDIEILVQVVARNTNQLVDWYYAGGRAIVLAVGDLDLVRSAFSAQNDDRISIRGI